MRGYGNNKQQLITGDLVAEFDYEVDRQVRGNRRGKVPTSLQHSMPGS